MAGSAYSASPTVKTTWSALMRARPCGRRAPARRTIARAQKSSTSVGRPSPRSVAAGDARRTSSQRIVERPHHDLLLPEHAVDREGERLAVAADDERLGPLLAGLRAARASAAQSEERHRLAAALQEPDVRCASCGDRAAPKRSVGSTSTISSTIATGTTKRCGRRSANENDVDDRDGERDRRA